MTHLRSAKRDMNSSKEHPHVVQKYLKKEVIEGREADPFRRAGSACSCESIRHDLQFSSASG